MSREVFLVFFIAFMGFYTLGLIFESCIKEQKHTSDVREYGMLDFDWNGNRKISNFSMETRDKCIS